MWRLVLVWWRLDSWQLCDDYTSFFTTTVQC